MRIRIAAKVRLQVDGSYLSLALSVQQLVRDDECVATVPARLAKR